MERKDPAGAQRSVIDPDTLHRIDRAFLIMCAAFATAGALFIVFLPYILSVPPQTQLREEMIPVPIVLFLAVWYFGIHRKVQARLEKTA